MHADTPVTVQLLQKTSKTTTGYSATKQTNHTTTKNKEKWISSPSNFFN